MTEMQEARLLKRLAGGNETALGEIIDAYAPYVAAVVWYISNGALTAQDAEEVSSDVFVTLWQNSAKARPGRLKGYLGAIARSRTLNALRKKGREPVFEDDELAVSEQTPEREVERMMEADAVRGAVEALPEADRDIFLRHYFLCRTVAEVSDETGVNPNTVKSRLKRGRETLKAILIKGGYSCE